MWVLLRNSISTHLSEFLLSQTGLESMSISHVPVGLEGSGYNGEGLNRLPRKMVESPSLEGFKKSVGIALRDMVWSSGRCGLTVGLDDLIGLSKLNDSMIL